MHIEGGCYCGALRYVADGAPVVREFCTRTPRRPGAVVLKVGTFDDPALFGGPQVAIWTRDGQEFHHIPDGMPRFERFPE